MLEPSLTSPAADLVAHALQSGSGFETGRKIITFRDHGVSSKAMEAGLSVSAATRVAHSAEFAAAVNFSALGDADYIIFDELGVALASGQPQVADQVGAVGVGTSDSAILAVESEMLVFSAQIDPTEYLRGFGAAVERIRQDLAPGAAPSPASEIEDGAALTAATWGLLATRATSSNFSGRDIKVAVLDTGFDMQHPDFRDRFPTSQSFVPSQTVQDLKGHGTHTAGTVFGPKAPVAVPRYGIATEAQMFIGKVLPNSGPGPNGWVLAGINWAIANRCEVISMSLSGPGGPFAYYTQAGQRALNAGGLAIAAAGNDSRRPGHIAPVGAPANSPTIVSVGALTQNLGISPFSNRGVEIAGPGSDVYSSWPMPLRYKTISGTSMATPHVSACAALYAQANPALRGAALRAALTRAARRLPLPAADMGAGLVQAP